MSALKEKQPENVNRRGEPEIHGMGIRRWEFVYSTVVPALADSVEMEHGILRPVHTYNLYTLSGSTSRVGCYAVRLDTSGLDAKRVYTLCGKVHALVLIADVKEPADKVCPGCASRIQQARVQAALRENLPAGHVIVGPFGRERVERFHEKQYRMDRELARVPDAVWQNRSMMDGAPGQDETIRALPNDLRSRRDVHSNPSESEREGMTKSQLRRAKRKSAAKRKAASEGRKQHSKTAAQNAASGRWAFINKG